MTVDADAPVWPTTFDEANEILLSLRNLLHGQGYDVIRFGFPDCVLALLESRERLAGLVSGDTVSLVDRLTVALQQADMDLSHMRVIANLWERRARECAVPADVEYWACEDQTTAHTWTIPQPSEGDDQ